MQGSFDLKSRILENTKLDILDRIHNEWKHISKYPRSIIVVIVIAFSITYLINLWYYKGVIDSLKEREETYKTQISAKDDLLIEYRERLHLVSASGSEYSSLTHIELKNKTLEFVQKLREWKEIKNKENKSCKL